MYPGFDEQVVESISDEYELLELHFTRATNNATARADPNPDTFSFSSFSTNSPLSCTNLAVFFFLDTPFPLLEQMFLNRGRLKLSPQKYLE